MHDDDAAAAPGGVGAEVAAALGSPVAVATRAAWGFKNETWHVVLGGGRNVVVQIFRDRVDAARRVDTMQQLRRLADLPIPQVLASSITTSRPWAAYPRLPGRPGYDRAGSDLSDGAWPELAREMGVVVRGFRLLPVTEVALPDLWADLERLSRTARVWARAILPHCTPSTGAAVMSLIDAIADTLGRFSPAVCHGDFGPQNVLFDGDAVSGILDFEDTRLAHPLLDIAWWNWLVRAHTPVAFERSWEQFLDGAGVDPGSHGFAEQIHLLIVLRLLETAEGFRRAQPEKHASWGARIEAQLAGHS